MKNVLFITIFFFLFQNIGKVYKKIYTTIGLNNLLKTKFRKSNPLSIFDLILVKILFVKIIFLFKDTCKDKMKKIIL